MTSLADRTIAALRAEHDRLAALVPGLTEAQLTGPSGASEWTVAAVLSHLGSGAEITTASLDAALGRTPLPDDGFNQRVWDRWDALPPRRQADDFAAREDELMTAFENLDAGQRSDLRVEVGFFPQPLSVATFAGIRFNEVVLHCWDALVGLNPGQQITEESAAVALEQLGGDLGLLLGFIGQADALAEPAVVALGDTGWHLVVADTIALTKDAPPPTARLTGPAEAAVRLIGGRLGPDHTAPGVTVEGNVSLDDLRAVFRGF